MPSRMPNYEELPRYKDAVDIFSGDVNLFRVPFACQIEALVVVLDVALDANDVDLKLTDGTNDLTELGNLISTDTAGKRIAISGNGTEIAAGGKLVLDIVESAAVTAGVVDLMVVLRKVEGGRPVDWAENT